jgi:hypothetical protein
VRDRQEVTIRQSGSQGQELILEEVDEGYDGEYVVEYMMARSNIMVPTTKRSLYYWPIGPAVRPYIYPMR